MTLRPNLLRLLNRLLKGSIELLRSPRHGWGFVQRGNCPSLGFHIFCFTFFFAALHLRRTYNRRFHGLLRNNISLFPFATQIRLMTVDT